VDRLLHGISEPLPLFDEPFVLFRGGPFAEIEHTQLHYGSSSVERCEKSRSRSNNDEQLVGKGSLGPALPYCHIGLCTLCLIFGFLAAWVSIMVITNPEPTRFQKWKLVSAVATLIVSVALFYAVLVDAVRAGAIAAL
jgi:hypothetical protein